ncbi:MAG: hypothetical protein AVDCRST_MAG56-3056 [uncultured Cytophagales bacterium]|uniref:DUF7619 domain-containing protein n=1 Tax=uncultured Cytophagales bacterium TaxID=158755 RepID=A0A6J4JA75_9SPHI|nr:MAG: hypothetical protein AVDCRST_MAG56-3056 [uncultured Cytophagales bacterium]
MHKHLPGLLVALLFTFSAFAQDFDSTMWVADNPVITVTRGGNTIYLGGQFSSIGPPTGNGATLNAQNGTLPAVLPAKIVGTVRTSVPDGKGGWYVGGEITRVGNQPRTGLAHILADGKADPDWDVKIDGERGQGIVYTLALANNILYVGGDFATAGGQPRNALFAVDAPTGRVTGWNPQADQVVYTLTVSGNTVYAGGSFTAMGGQRRAYLAAIDATSGGLKDWNPGANASVDALVVAGSTVYARGSFTQVGGQFRNRLAALDAVTGQVNGWNPSPDEWVSALTLSGNTIYVGGFFQTIGGQARERLAAFDATTGQLTAWQPRTNGDVSALAISGNVVVLGGNFSNLNGGRSNSLGAVDATTGQSVAWNHMASGRVLTISVAGERMFVGGELTSVGMQPRNGFAAVDATTGKVTPWNPGIEGAITSYCMAVAGGKVYLGANNDTTDPAQARSLYVVDAVTGARSKWDPIINGNVLSMEVAGNILYLGGNFTEVDGQTRKGLAAVDWTTDQLTPWSPRMSEQPLVWGLVVRQGIVYVGGEFTAVNEVPRYCLAAVDAASGEVTPWNPDLPAPGAVYSLALHGNHLIVAGFFNVPGQTQTQALRSFDLTTARLTDWKPQLDNSVYMVAVAGNLVYVAGRHPLVKNADPSGVVAFDALSGQLAPWNPSVAGDVLGLSQYKGSIYAVGTFYNVQGQVRHHFVAFPARSSYGLVKGRVYEDANGDCVFNNGEKGMAGRVVVTRPGNYFSFTDSLGNYAITVDTGRYTVEQVVPANLNPYTRRVCPANPNSHAVHVTQYGSTVAGYDFANQTAIAPLLSVGVSSDRRRRCFTSVTTVSYCNEGLAAAQNVRVHVQLPGHVALVGARQPYAKDREGNYVFTIGTLAAGSCGTIQLVDSVVCNDPAIRGLTQCTKAWITPVNDRTPGAGWDRSDVTLKASCGNNGRVRLALYNTGTSNMADSSAYRIYLDAGLAFTRNYKLAKGDSLVLHVPANGRTVRLEADQRPAHPDKRQSNITLEACGTNGGGTVSKGFVGQFPQDDEAPEVAIECLPIIDSFDPNDKAVSPEGVTDQRYTPTGRVLDYVVRFQNTGTDVAYQVVVVDTLSEYLDISTLRVGAVSHPYKMQVSGKGRPVLTFTFNGINLPDSTADEPRSHGRIQFSIQPKAGLPEKTRVGNFADIFFDYNEPVRTNTTLNTIYDVPPVVAADVALAPGDVCPDRNAAVRAGANRTVCAQDTVKLSAEAPPEGNGRWKLLKGAGTIREGNRPNATVTGLAYGENVFEWRIPAGGCGTDSLAAHVTITRLEKPVPVITQSGADELVCSVAGSRYEWFLDGTKLDQAGRQIRVSQPGRYTVRVEMSSGCHSDPSEAYAYGVTGVGPGALAAVRIFPNPTPGRLVIALPVAQSGPVEVLVVDKIGRTVLVRTVNPAGGAGECRVELDLSAQATGLYVIKLQTGNSLIVRSVFKK